MKGHLSPLLLLLLQVALPGGQSQPWTVETVHPEVRLVDDGNSTCSGRVEVFYNGTWGTVCDDFWDFYDAAVVCRQLGCGNVESIHPYAHFGQGSGRIWMDNVHCLGTESYLAQCPHNGFGDHNCHHFEDAGVVCAAEPTNATNEVRLVDDGNNCSGRVEVLYNGTWGTICDDFWDMRDATVVCRQLGCGNATRVRNYGYFGQGSGRIWMDNVHCLGNEPYLAQCAHNGFGDHNCVHLEDAGVVCEDAVPPTVPPNAIIEVRLVDGVNSTCSGRVEVLVNGQWGTVCDDFWDYNDATVVCRQLGCGSAIRATRYAHFGLGSGRIWMDNVHCTGTESYLSQCAHNGFGDHNCIPYEDAGVVCEEPVLTTTSPTTTAHPEDVLSSSSLVCSRDQMEVCVSLGYLQANGLSAENGHLSIPQCSAHSVSEQCVSYQAPRQSGQCGNTVMTNGTHAIYHNALFLYPQDTTSFVLPVIVPFSCVYPLTTNTTLNDQAQLLQNEGGLSGLGAQPAATMNLYQDPTFTEQVPSGPFSLEVGSPLYVGVTSDETDSIFTLVFDSCYTSHSSNPVDTPRYYLINSSCPVDPRHVSVIKSGQTLQACLAALIFPVESDNDSVYLHCTLSFCDTRDSNCAPDCERRSKRSLHKASQFQLDPVTAGPIYWKH